MLKQLITKIEDMSIKELLDYKIKIQTSNGNTNDKEKLLDLISNRLTRTKAQDTDDIFVEMSEPDNGDYE